MTTRQLIVTRSVYTGDIPHVAAALALYPNTSLLIVCDTAVQENASLINFCLKAAGNVASRVMGYRPELDPKPTSGDLAPLYAKAAGILYSELKNSANGDIGWTQKQPELNNWAKGKGISLNGFSVSSCLTSSRDWIFNNEYSQNLMQYDSGGEKQTYTALPVTGATTLVADAFKKKNVEQVRKTLVDALASNINIIDDKTDNKPTFVLPDPTKLGDKMVLLLWSRYSGQNTWNGYNPAGDSDPRGQEELIQAGKDLGFIVVTIGHGPVQDRRKRSGQPPEPDYKLGEFYEKPIINKDRAKQFSFFLGLSQRYPKKIMQMGQKTGGMDSAALMGIPTLYIEDKESPSRERMLKWVKSVPFYSDASTEEPPSPLGKSLRTLARAYPNDTEATNLIASTRIRVAAWVRLLMGSVKNTKDVLFKNKELLEALSKAMGRQNPPSNLQEWEGKNALWKDNLDETALKPWLESMQKLSPGELDSNNIISGYTWKDPKPGIVVKDVDFIKTKLTELRDKVKANTP
jgi:hypothetical protein